MRTGLTSESLLARADTLAHVKDDSTAVHVRGAISSAYYAAFHGLVAEATAHELGVDRRWSHDRQLLSRWYGHRDLRTASEWVIRRDQRRPVPEGVAELLDEPPRNLVAVARTFLQLQHTRHEADYDHRVELDQADAQDAIDSAWTMLRLVRELAGDRVFGNYLALMGAARRVGR